MIFKQSFKQFMESKELGVLRPRPLSPVELKKSKAAAQAISDLFTVISKKSAEVTKADILELHKKLQANASKVKFVKRIAETIQSLIDADEKTGKAGDYILKNHKELKKDLANLKSAFMKKDFKSAAKHTKILNNHFDSIDHHVELPAKAHTILTNRYTASPSFFGSLRLLDIIGYDDYVKINNIDFSKQLFTAIDFPSSKEDDFDYVLYFLKNLADSPKPVRINSSHEFRIHSKVANASDEKFEKLQQLTDKYLHSNDKALIEPISKLIKAIPSINAANEKAKRKTKVVYRGLGFSSKDAISIKAMIENDRKQRYVATSDSKYAAKNFALQKGHLEHEDMRRSDYGIILVYKVTPEAILFDTKVVDTAYNESEILIDATKAEVIETIEL